MRALRTVPFVILLLLTACGGGEEEASFPAAGKRAAEMSEPMMMEAPPAARGMVADEARSMPAPDVRGGGDAALVERKIAKTASLRVRVDDLDEFVPFVQQSARAAGGYVASLMEHAFESRRTADLTIRVPSEKLDTFLETLTAGAAYVEQRALTLDDVTEQYVDTEARLHARRELEKRYLQLLAQARTVEDMVAIEAQLANVREQIESMEAILKMLDQQVDLATVHLSAYQEIEGSFVFGGSLIKAVQRAFREGISAVISVALFFVRLWPFLVAGALLAWWLRRRRRA